MRDTLPPLDFGHDDNGPWRVGWKSAPGLPEAELANTANFTSYLTSRAIDYLIILKAALISLARPKRRKPTREK